MSTKEEFDLYLNYCKALKIKPYSANSLKCFMTESIKSYSDEYIEFCRIRELDLKIKSSYELFEHHKKISKHSQLTDLDNKEYRYQLKQIIHKINETEQINNQHEQG